MNNCKTSKHHSKFTSLTLEIYEVVGESSGAVKFRLNIEWEKLKNKATDRTRWFWKDLRVNSVPTVNLIKTKKVKTHF